MDERVSISSTNYAAKCKDLMELYRDLSDLGARSIGFDFPRVVVIGGQSSGKSSLVEAVSGINVPRDSGTCTRCPMICNMSSKATSWWCSIDICYEFDKNDRPQTPVTAPFVSMIENKPDVELWIRRAQATILSPHRSASHFLSMSDAELRSNALADADMLQFSRNYVQVTVRDPEATDLSFVDLPGLITNAEKKLINTVQSLVESYIQGQNTLIVIAMPMNDDIDMMQAIKLASEADPEKERTIGVLTKPDTLSKGAKGGREKWRAVLEGREHATTLGYYCVRLPDDEERERKITPIEAANIATTFFDSTAPWSEIQDRSRFGIPNFVTNVSALLVTLIEKNIKPLRDAVDAELRKCLQEIEKLPPVSTVEPSTEIMLRVNAFCKDVAYAVRGEADKYNKFVQDNTARYLVFKEDIVRTAPDFRPFEDVNDRRSSALIVTRTEPRGLPYVRDAIAKSITWELPGHLPYKATKSLITQYTGLWHAPATSCLDSISDNLKNLAEQLIGLHFGQYKALEKYARLLIFQELQRCFEEASSVLRKVLKWEQDPLFTQNFGSLKTEETKWLANYTNENNMPITYGESDSRNRGPYAISKVPPFDPMKENPERWGVNDELKVMANVQGYFQVAYKRVIDYVPLAIEHELNGAFSSGVEMKLLDNIFKGSETGGKFDAEELLSEDPIVAKHRMELGTRRIRLLQIKEKLDNFRAASSLPPAYQTPGK